MRFERMILLVAILLFSADLSYAADITANSCSRADVQDALDAATDGDRVLVPSGTCTWSASVSIPDTKGIVLQGAGIGQTTVVDGFTNGSALWVNVASGNSVTRVTGFTFNANGVSKSGTNAEIAITGSGLDRFRIHDNDFRNIRRRGISVFMNGRELSGLIDNNSLHAPYNSAQAIAVFGCSAQCHTPFSRPLELGSSKFIFVEDNRFDYPGGPTDGALDAYGGARYVFRHNTVIGTTIGHHGADSGGYRGVHSFELYNNNFTNNTQNSRAAFFRSGSGVVFNNTWTGNYTNPDVVIYRARPQSFAPWGACDGSSPWDENSGGSALSCLDQPGRVFTANQGGSNALEPLYFWNNNINGTPTTTNVSESSSGAFLREGTEFYSNTPRPSYASYTYPHPLQAASSQGGTLPPPPPPSNLRIVP